MTNKGKCFYNIIMSVLYNLFSTPPKGYENYKYVSIKSFLHLCTFKTPIIYDYSAFGRIIKI